MSSEWDVATARRKIKRIGNTLLGAPRLYQRLDDLEQRVRFLAVENLRLNELIRELIYRNSLSRNGTGSQTKASFDYQWRVIPEGESMPSNPDFLREIPEMLIERTRRPREWFPGKKVLDAGCGSGRWTYGLAKLGAEVTSVDQSPGGLAATRKLSEGVGSVTLHQADLLKLDLPVESFDLVWCFGVAHHTENLLLAMENVMARVKSGGWLFMMLYAYPRETHWFRCMAEYEEYRQQLKPLKFAEKVEFIRKMFPPEQVHGAFDALSPLINELVTWEWIQSFVQERGFDSVTRTLEHTNHHFVARLLES